MLVGGKLVPLGGGGGPCGIRGRILMSRFCSSIPQHLGPVVWAPRSLVTSKTRVSLVAGRSGTEDAQCQGGTEVARYHRPFEARSTNSTRRETYRQLAVCDSAPHGGWFAPLSLPPGSPTPLAPVSEPLGGNRPRETQQPRRKRL